MDLQDVLCTAASAVIAFFLVRGLLRFLDRGWM